MNPSPARRKFRGEIAEADTDGISVAPPDRTWPTIDVFAVPEAKSVKNRLHLDLRADGCSTVEELQRLLNLGARRVDVGQAADVSWVVLADPEGNEFCLLARAVQERAAMQWTRPETFVGQPGMSHTLLARPGSSRTSSVRAWPPSRRQTPIRHPE
jgi:hypothetical protein